MLKIASDRSMWLFLVTGLLVQIITFCAVPHNPWAMVSGMLGICSVVLGAKGNILTFFFGFAQVGTYTYLCWVEHFYAEIAINIYYLIRLYKKLRLFVATKRCDYHTCNVSALTLWVEVANAVSYIIYDFCT